MVRLGAPDRANTSTVLFELTDLPDDAEVRATIRLEPTDRSDGATVLEGWDDRLLTIEPNGARYHLDVASEVALDPADLGFGHGFLRRAHVQGGSATGSPTSRACTPRPASSTGPR